MKSYFSLKPFDKNFTNFQGFMTLLVMKIRKMNLVSIISNSKLQKLFPAKIISSKFNSSKVRFDTLNNSLIYQQATDDLYLNQKSTS